MGFNENRQELLQNIWRAYLILAEHCMKVGAAWQQQDPQVRLEADQRCVYVDMPQLAFQLLTKVCPCNTGNVQKRLHGTGECSRRCYDRAAAHQAGPV